MLLPLLQESFGGLDPPGECIELDEHVYVHVHVSAHHSREAPGNRPLWGALGLCHRSSGRVPRARAHGAWGDGVIR